VRHRALRMSTRRQMHVCHFSSAEYEQLSPLGSRRHISYKELVRTSRRTHTNAVPRRTQPWNVHMYVAVCAAAVKANAASRYSTSTCNLAKCILAINIK
jgi:hypothetical protein